MFGPVEGYDAELHAVSAPRLRRLAADYESVRAEFSGHPHVQIAPIGSARPSEAYRITYRVRGLRLDGDRPVTVDHHEVEVRLPLGYPREKPICTPLTPVFHPNIKGYYCIQDYWAAGQPLADTIVKIADMLQFRIYNPASPLDATAAQWARANAHLFPIGHVDLGRPELDIRIGGVRRIGSLEPPRSADTEPLPLMQPISEQDDAMDELVVSLHPQEAS